MVSVVMQTLFSYVTPLIRERQMVFIK
jgi:hypothetical protein